MGSALLIFQRAANPIFLGMAGLHLTELKFSDDRLRAASQGLTRATKAMMQDVVAVVARQAGVMLTIII